MNFRNVYTSLITTAAGEEIRFHSYRRHHLAALEAILIILDSYQFNITRYIKYLLHNWPLKDTHQDILCRSSGFLYIDVEFSEVSINT